MLAKSTPSLYHLNLGDGFPAPSSHFKNVFIPSTTSTLFISFSLGSAATQNQVNSHTTAVSTAGRNRFTSCLSEAEWVAPFSFKKFFFFINMTKNRFTSLTTPLYQWKNVRKIFKVAKMYTLMGSLPLDFTCYCHRRGVVTSLGRWGGTYKNPFKLKSTPRGKHSVQPL